MKFCARLHFEVMEGVRTVKESEGEAEKSLRCHQMHSTAKSGMAAIKHEFIDSNYRPRLVTAYLPESAVDEIQHIISLQGAVGKDDQTLEPPSKKPRLKGRNKKRPIERRLLASEKLCPNIVGGRICSFGEKCKFSHDVKKFLESRPHSIEGKCYVFEMYGKCPFGVTCLFADQHMQIDSVSETKLETEKITNDQPRVKNVISKDLQIKLRKKEYNFKRANHIIKQFHEKPKDISRKRTADGISVAALTVNQQQSGLNMISTNTNLDAKKCLDLPLQCCLSSNCATNAELSRGDAKLECDVDSKPPQVCLLKDDDLIQEGDSVDKKTNESVEINMQKSTDDEILSQEMKGTEVAVEGNHPSAVSEKLAVGCISDEDIIKLQREERKKVDFKDKLYLAPLTTVGNLPFRRICRRLGADVTCGEMAMSSNLLQGQASEWALLKRHESETLFGVQLCASYSDSMTRAAQVIVDTMEVDFIDVNLGCPIDLVVQKGEGCAVMGRISRLEQIVYGMSAVMNVPLTVKMRTGLFEGKNIAHTLLPKVRDWGVSMATVHGRSREQRYTKLADWNYIRSCVNAARPMQIFGNGDILSYLDYNNAVNQSGADGCMIARGALIKPWLFTEIKEQRHWDISASERLEIVKEYVNYGLEHWGSDQQGVASTRRFLLEWLSFVYRYIPVGILEHVPQRINEKPPHYFGRNDLETLLASPNCADWIKISEMFLGPVPTGFTFLPKHRANAYQ